MALDAMRRAYADEEVRFMIEEREKAEHQWATDIENAHQEGKTEGKAEGKVEGKVEVARQMLASGVDPDMVFKFTGLHPQDFS